jgi:hypothetical protein
VSEVTTETELVDNLQKVLLIAERQRNMVFAFGFYYVLALIAGQFLDDARIYGQIIMSFAWLTIMIFTSRLCIRMFGIFPTILLVLLSTQLLVNLLTLGVASWESTKRISNSGFEVRWYNVDSRVIEQKLNRAKDETSNA